MRILLGPNELVLHDSADLENRRVFRPIDIWDKTAAPTAELVGSGAGPGAVPVGRWQPKEKYGTLGGRALTDDWATHQAFRRELLVACRLGETVELVIEDDGGGRETMFVRRWDEADPQWFNERWTAYTLPLVAPDPFRYGPSLGGGSMGVFTGSAWFTEPAVDIVPTPDLWYVAADVAGAPDAILFEQAQVSSEFLPAVTINSTGDQPSRRLLIEATGPLTGGDWQLLHEQTGAEVWADLTLLAGQAVLFDCYRQTATLDGAPIDSLVFGDFLTVEPGPNTYRLVSGTQSAGFATVTEARPANE